MKVLILGAGAVGGYVGARLVATGADVVFLVRGRRLTEVAERGLTIESPLGNFSGPVRALGAVPDGFDPEVVILTCKSPALDAAMQAIAPGVKPGTRILPLLNGLAHLDVLARTFPDAPILGGLVHGALALQEDGVIAHLTPFFSMIFGAVSRTEDPVAGELARALAAVHVDARESPDIHQDMWNKFVFLTTLAGMTCLMRASIGTIVAADGGERLIVQLLDETLAIARAEGHAPDDAAMSSYRKSLTEPGSTFTSSMLRDMLAGRRTEADHIVGDMLRRGRTHGLATPVLSTVNAALQCYEAQLS